MAMAGWEDAVLNDVQSAVLKRWHNSTAPTHATVCKHQSRTAWQLAYTKQTTHDSILPTFVHVTHVPHLRIYCKAFCHVCHVGGASPPLWYDDA